MILKIAVIVFVISYKLHPGLSHTDYVLERDPPSTNFLPRVRNVKFERKLVNSALDGMCFTLQNGTDFNPRNATDLAKAINEVALLHSPDFLTWIEDKSKAEKSQILSIVEPVPIKDNEMKPKVEALKTFNNAEKGINESSKFLTEINNGSFLLNYATKNSKAVSLVMSNKVFWKSVKELKSVKTKITQSDMVLSNLTDLAIYMEGETCMYCGPAADGFDFIHHLTDLAEGVKDGDWAAFSNALYDIFGTALGLLESAGMSDIVSFNKFVFPLGDLGFTGYNLYKDIDNLVHGNLSGIELAIGIIDLIKDVTSMVTSVIGMAFGPLGELVGKIVDVALEWVFSIVEWILKAKLKDKIAHEKLNQLVSSIYLTPEERDREFQRFKSDQEANQYLIDLAQQKAGNNILVDNIAKELATSKMSNIRLYVAPAVCTNNLLCDDSIADLRSRTSYPVQRWAPDQSAIGTCCPWTFVNQIECFPKAEPGEDSTHSEYNVFSCTNAVGVRGVRNIAATHDLIALSNGSDYAYASNSFPSIFSVGQGSNVFTGGDSNDIFLISETSSRGKLMGGNGNDTLNIGLPDDFHQRVFIDLHSKTLNTGSAGTLQLQIESMEVVRGRAGEPETISPTCDTMYVQSLQGSATLSDEINISAACEHALVIMLESYTRVYVDSEPQGSITLNVSSPTTNSTPGPIDITIHSGSIAQTNVLLNFSLSSIPIPSFDQHLGKIDIRSKSFPTSQYLTISPIFSKDTGEMTAPSILFQDSVSVKVDLGGVFSLVRSISEQEQFQGESWAQHVVYVNSSTQAFNFKGGPLNDTLVVQDLGKGGTLDGDGGKNILAVGNTFGEGKQVKVDLIEEKLTTTGVTTTQVTRFQTVMGRSDGEDLIIPNCDTAFVDGQGFEGSTTTQDLIEIHDLDCEYNLMTVVRQNTRVQNTVSGNKDSTFIYALNIAPNIEFDLSYDNPNVSHLMLIQSSIDNIQNVTVDPDTSILKINGRNGNTVDMKLGPVGDDDGYLSPNFLTNDTQAVLIHPAQSKEITVIFNITKPATETFSGTDFGTNFFLINASVDQVIGGKAMNAYSVTSSNFTGTIDGTKGPDRLLIGNEYKPNQVVNLHLLGSKTKPRKSALENGDMTLIGIEEVFGRSNETDVITIQSCETSRVSGQSGSQILGHDLIKISELDCVFDLQLVVGDLTAIENNGKEGSVFYFMETNEEAFDFVTETSPLVNHTVLTGWSRENVSQVMYIEDSHSFQLEHTVLGQKFVFKLAPLETNNTYVTSPIIFTQEFFEFKIDVQGNVSAKYLIKEADEEITGFSYLPNIFMSGGNSCIVEGGDKDDTLLITNLNFTGEFHGGDGSNSIYVIGGEGEGTFTMMTMNNTEEDGKAGVVLFSKVKNIHGGDTTDETAHIDCDVEIVDLHSGNDRIVVPIHDGCQYSTNIAVYENLVIENAARNGSFVYILRDDISFTLNCRDCLNATHLFVVPYNLSSIASIQVKNETKIVTMTNVDGTIREYAMSGQYYFGYPSFLTQDSVQIQLTHISINARVQADKDEVVGELVPKWRDVAKKLNMSVTVIVSQTGEDDTYINIGREGFDLLTTSRNHKSVMVGNGGSNVYIVGKGDDMDIKSLKEVVIYGEANSTEIVDLTQLIRPLREKIRLDRSEDDKTLYVPEVLYETTDLVVHVLDNPPDPNGGSVRVVIKDWASWYMNVTFVLNEAMMELKYRNGLWSLEPVPIPVNETYSVLDQSHFEDNQIIVLDHNFDGENQTQSAITSQGNDVVLTNVFNASSDDMFVTVFKDYNNALATRKRGHKLKDGTSAVLPLNIQIKFKNDVVVNLDEIEIEKLRPIDEVMDEQEEIVDLVVWGFKCTEQGAFPDPRFCNVYHQCSLFNGEWIEYEMECPLGTVFCIDMKVCSYPGSCRDCSNKLRHNN